MEECQREIKRWKDQIRFGAAVTASEEHHQKVAGEGIGFTAGAAPSTAVPQNWPTGQVLRFWLGSLTCTATGTCK
eukprot:c1992_g1_i1 orf=3-224(-)